MMIVMIVIIVMVRVDWPTDQCQQLKAELDVRRLCNR